MVGNVIFCSTPWYTCLVIPELMELSSGQYKSTMTRLLLDPLFGQVINGLDCDHSMNGETLYGPCIVPHSLFLPIYQNMSLGGDVSWRSDVLRMRTPGQKMQLLIADFKKLGVGGETFS